MEKNEIKYIETDLKGIQLLRSAQLNKGTAFSDTERKKFFLKGLLPPVIETIEDQMQRAYHQYSLQTDDLQKNIFLNNLYNTNETLFFRLISEYIEEMMPIIYTPTAGLAIQHYSSEFRTPRGIYISYPDQDNIDEILNNLSNDINLIVLTDSEQILGIGDQGANGIGISVAKIVIYTLCAGINPKKMLPVMIDVGTNNPQLLRDPLYIGWRHSRIQGKAYDQFVSKVVKAIKQKFPDVFLQWEDFGKTKARCNLNQYQDKICTFNDDIQGTGAVATAAILNASKLTHTRLSDHRIVIFGAGTAGCGIADRICEWMIKEGLSSQKARSRFWLMDSQGLVTNDRENLDYFKASYARPQEESQNGDKKSKNTSLLDVVCNVKPTILIGTSAVNSAFDIEVIKAMASGVEYPIIFPLSNPPIMAEATPENILRWTDGNAIVATGSPYPDVILNDKSISVAQCNNALIFPGLGLGIICAHAKRVTSGMIDAAVKELSNSVNLQDDHHSRLLPEVSRLQEVSRDIAVAVVKKAIAEKTARINPNKDISELVNENIWKPVYVPYH
ncbi:MULTISPECIES: NAD-dependent malic enzyme [Methanobacterium]|jgi:malate dehydrogenase (oxaloacetate-decarboxylating)|uniref:NAD-dependent malic enzyme n=1 Tax=Methanobacterium veterum TaxID=408577 RepID=A0A9E5A3X7_9EURY|nr:MULTISPECIES: NAD-dependent malic enzyme [Methanobacterium]MCZ3365585.1 NAD-dependent malic enzyme [Methanobacterium veterum]MCZ3371048.1 NAD-dependent malic enzyme [Methanobacterium veterum]